MAVAGCGSHTARIVDRSGANITNTEVLTEVEWHRILDDTSFARVIVTPEGDCCQRLGTVRSWRNKLQIFRNGVFVWGGPILNIDWTRGKLEIWAGDVLAWLDRRVPHADQAFRHADLTEIARWLIDDGYFPDDPGHTVQVIGPAGVTGSRRYYTDVEQTGDHLRDLADNGLDYTAVGDTIILLPETHCAPVGRLTDVDMPEGLTVSEDGQALGTRWIVAGGEDDDGNPVTGVAGGMHNFYGLLERWEEETSINDPQSAVEAAGSKLRAGLPVPLFVDTEEVTIAPEAAVDIPSLVPGWCLDVTATLTCRTVTQRLKIVGLNVTENGEGEKVSVQVAATGAEDESALSETLI